VEVVEVGFHGVRLAKLLDSLPLPVSWT